MLPQGPDEDVEEVVEEEEEQEDPEMAQALRDACFEAARIAANDSSERPTKTAFAIFKETSMKAAVRQAVSDLPHAIDATRVHLTMTWVVSFLILSRFGPRDTHPTHRSPRPWTATLLTTIPLQDGIEN